MLKVRDLEVYYGLIRAVKKISFQVEQGQIVSLIGSNGAGKTSTLKSIVNDVKRKGRIYFEGHNISKLNTPKVIQSGISLVPEGRRVFINLTVDENLRMGAFNNDEKFESLQESMYDLFPRLKQKRKQLAGTMSGGEQQMLAIARALMCSPKLLMLDEPSLGLAPKIIGEVFDIITQLKEDGITILLVEQNAFAALNISDYAYVLENGEIALKDNAKELINSDEIRKKYLGA
ncbi:ABC transporter ATP-binding protein [Malaciobacter molluscorum LMG 25693]|uniref:ABC transporter ATP-binding protein n=1 Tax=Malaciobacter molluscorum LMG 25693 TaxID=870501 RepID=A0A2G1DLP6_9BACT|nr:ABC transporter ATP-binding protein [Malaciobacter molluscorum]AXX92085.1 high-affinity branched-chain amino acid ABC transporter, ATP-binding protein [Malaciobacter molluscorum LMG 25693]PHO19314.1 ABC transporter ATP-binding protein [Malaciobacter molluscorum LMG 25693]RXJ96425.1 ABC transporter ATP-binding protein [Malaciobacter molluscorum]